MSRRSVLALAGLLVVLAGCAGPVAPHPGDTPGSGVRTPADAGTRAPAGTPRPATAPRVRVTVTKVVDGDTVDVRYANGTTATVRLLGVDAPEVHAETTPGEYEGVPDTAAGRRCLRRAGAAAGSLARDRLAGATVGLGFDPAADRRGGYGRLLAYVYVDGDQFNHRLVADGHARLYEGPFVEERRYAAAERRARAAHRGLWACTDAG